jgi:phytoene synthase
MLSQQANVQEAIAYCTQMTKEHSSTFYLGSRLFPKEQRRAVSVTYALCRSGDDAVDECATVHEGRMNLDNWWQHIERGYSGMARPSEPLEVGLSWLLERFEVPKNAFEELYLGLEADLEKANYQTMEELMVYCRRVAGVVGFMIAPIAGYRGGEDTLHNALALGQAMQLTNILRDVGEDLQRGRCYLPVDLLAEYGVCLDDLRAGKVTANYIELLEHLAQISQQLYRLGWRGIPKLKGPAAMAVAVAAMNYEGILLKLRQNHYDNLTRRAYLKTYERLALIPKAVYGVLVG